MFCGTLKESIGATGIWKLRGLLGHVGVQMGM